MSHTFRSLSYLGIALAVAGVGCGRSAKNADQKHAIQTQALIGAAGAPTISNTQTVNSYTAVTSIPNVTTVAVASAAGLAAGDLVLVIQMQGATIDGTDTVAFGAVTAFNNAGNFELIQIASVAGNNLTLVTPGLKRSYAAAGRVQVIKVPQYLSLTVAAGGRISAPAWNGATGGVVALHVNGALTLTGDVDVSALGFRGGALDNATGNLATTYRSLSDNDGAEKGESIAGYQGDYTVFGGRYGRGAPANGGGGGNNHNAGGGGGANASNGNLWTGQGVMDGLTLGGALAWPLDPGFIANLGLTNSSGGGRGGYTYSSANRDALTEGPGDTDWGGDQRQPVGGLGGRPLMADPVQRVFLGGGGGAGDANNNNGSRGAIGGGLIIVIAESIAGTGRFLANGENAPTAPANDAPGGGGGGGTVIVIARKTLAGVSVQAHGGLGGNQTIGNNEAEGPGGGGGGGYVALLGGPITTDVAGASGGTSNSGAVTEFPANGATGGAAGLLGAIPGTWVDALNIPSDVRVTVTNGATALFPGWVVNYTVAVNNAGQNLATGVTLTDVTGGLLTGVSWTCVATVGSTCPAASGVGDPTTQSVDVAPTGTVTFVVSGFLPLAAVGTVTNTATIVVPAGLVDDVANNSATDADVIGANSLPVAVMDTATVLEDGTVNINVLLNDTGLSDVPVVVQIGAAPLLGRVVVNVDNTVTYTPSPDRNGIDSFSYMVVDAHGDRSTAVVQVTVTAQNDAPVAAADTVAVTVDKPATISVLANDTGLGDGPVVVSVTQPTRGTVVVNPDNTVLYTPDTGYVGADSFTYTVRDLDNQTSVATVTLAVSAADPVPAAVADTVNVTEDVPAVLTPLLNDTGLGNGPIRVSLVAGPTRGTATVNSDGTISYVPAPDVFGADAITYRVTDNKGVMSTAIITVAVASVDDLPIAVPDSIQVGIGQTATVPVLDNDKGLGDGPLVVTVGPAVRGTVTVNGSNQVVYVPAGGFVGTEIISYTVRDLDNDSVTGQLVVTVGTPSVPLAVLDLAVLDEDSPLTVRVLANDTGLGSRPVSVRVSIAPLHGTATVNLDGSITFVPVADYNGADELTYELTDAAGTKSTAKLQFTINAVNDAPRAFPDSGTVAMGVTTLTLVVTTNDTDAENDTLVLSAVGTPAHGTATVLAPGSVVYTPTPGYSGWDVFTYTVGDGKGGLATGWVVVRVDGTMVDAGAPDAQPEDVGPVVVDMGIDAVTEDMLIVVVPTPDMANPLPVVDMAPPTIVMDARPDLASDRPSDVAPDAVTGAEAGVSDASGAMRDMGPGARPDVAPDVAPLATDTAGGTSSASDMGGAGDPFKNLSLRGGGCAVAPGEETSHSGLSLLGLGMLALVLARRRRTTCDGRRRTAPFFLLILATFLNVDHAHAQTDKLQSYPVERFRLATGRDGVLNAEWGRSPSQGAWNLGLWLGYANDPMVVYDATTGKRVSSLVSSRIGGSLVGSVALADRLALGLDLPVIVNQSGAKLGTAAQDLKSLGFGDLRVVPKIGLVRGDDDGLSLALIPAFSVPLSSGKNFFGDTGFTFAPEIAVSAMSDGGFRFVVDAGVRFRKKVEVVDLKVGNEAFAILGLGQRFGGARRPLEIDATLSTATGLDDLFGSRNRNALEATLGLVYDLDAPVSLFAAGGPGLRQGFGTPDYRVLGGLWIRSMIDDDPDKDGIRGNADECPLKPEDKDQFQDADGCPDPDNDKDRILDRKDRCPNEPETYNDYQDKDGCPDELPDTDGDGLRDPEDKCPTDPEDKDKFKDEDGCPDPDNDEDGTLDVADKCPMEPGPKANQGCPDPDRDGDGVVDREDNCPDEPGPKENQGCKVKQLAVLKGDKIEILEAVFFQTSKDVIQRKSYALLDNVASILQAHPEIDKVRIEGHTDSQGDDQRNQKLSERRAMSVVRYLTRAGVAAERMEAVGFGESQPIASNNTNDGRQQNRRVVFVIEKSDTVKVKE